MLTRIDDLHFDIHQLEGYIMDDLNNDHYNEKYPSFYDYMEAYDGKWSIEVIKTEEGHKDFIFFNELGENKIHYFESGYNNPINVMRGKEYTYIQNEDEQWLVCLNEMEIK